MAKGVKTGGRVKGSVNKATADLKALAQTYAPDAVKTLAEIMMTSENHTARIAASKELLDRGYGKSIQGVELTGKDGQPVVITRIERKIVDPK
jgi:3-methyladenine DNA glycosylase/8-oxoguanine DNA glycosylase